MKAKSESIYLDPVIGEGASLPQGSQSTPEKLRELKVKGVKGKGKEAIHLFGSCNRCGSQPTPGKPVYPRKASRAKKGEGKEAIHLFEPCNWCGSQSKKHPV